MNIQDILFRARNPKSVICPVCNKELFSPMDKLSIALYGKCCTHIENETEQDNLFELSKAL